MTRELSTDLIRSQLPKKLRHHVDDDTIEEIHKLAEEPDYGPEFLETYLEHLHVLGEIPQRTPANYLEAVKFFSLVEGGNNLTEAYIKVFPERFAHRTRNMPNATPSEKQQHMRHEAYRYNTTKLVNQIRKVATIPVQLIHRHLLHEAILQQAELMRTARSEMVRQKASETLIRELKPSEDTVLTIDVKDGARSAIEELRLATERLAVAEHQSVMAGVPLKQIAESKIHVENIEDAEYEEVPTEPVQSRSLNTGGKIPSPSTSYEENSPPSTPVDKRWTL